MSTRHIFFPRSRTAPALVLTATVALVGCASDFHYLQIVGTRYFKTNIDTYPVSINAVDGRSYLGNLPVLVDPGLRNVVVQGPPTFVDLSLTRTLVLDVKPCTRYYVVAEKASPLDTSSRPGSTSRSRWPVARRPHRSEPA